VWSQKTLLTLLFKAVEVPAIWVAIIEIIERMAMEVLEGKEVGVLVEIERKAVIVAVVVEVVIQA